MTIARRNLLGASLVAAGVTVYGAPAAAHPSSALSKLFEGNLRWVEDRLADRDPAQQRRNRVAGAQHPFAVVFSCIDSRVPPEVVFDQDVGDLFVVRTGAQALDALVLGSVQYGPAHGVPLVFVLGHTSCGAIRATVQSIEDGVHHSGQLMRLVAALEPAYRLAAQGFHPGMSREQRIDTTVQAQIALTVAILRADPLIRTGDTMVAGGRYDLKSGVVSRVA